MFGSEILDVAIGVVFVFVLVSLICSAVREGIEGLLKTRATHLEAGIRQLLQDQMGNGLARSLFEHPLVFGLFSGPYKPPSQGLWPSAIAKRWPTALTRGRNLPSYVPSRNFALALMDIAARGAATDQASGDPASPRLDLDTVRANVRNIGNPAIQRVLLTAIDTAQGDFNQAVANVEAWYDSGMDRVSGWYKRSTQLILFIIGVVVAVAINVDTIAVARFLYHQKAAREAIVAQAQSAVSNPALLEQNHRDTLQELQALRLPIGRREWVCFPAQNDSAADGQPPSATTVPATPVPATSPSPTTAPPAAALTPPAADVAARSVLERFEVVLGWMLTAFAATLGAPFWFDLLNKIMVIRSTVKPHEKSPEEASEDRQAPAGTGTR